MKIKSDKRQLTEGSNVENSITTVFRIFVLGKILFAASGEERRKVVNLKLDLDGRKYLALS